MPLSDSCKKHSVDLIDVLDDLNIISSIENNSDKNKQFETAKEVIDEIMSAYHEPLYEILPILNQVVIMDPKVYGCMENLGLTVRCLVSCRPTDKLTVLKMMPMRTF